MEKRPETITCEVVTRSLVAVAMTIPEPIVSIKVLLLAAVQTADHNQISRLDLESELKNIVKNLPRPSGLVRI